MRFADGLAVGLKDLGVDTVFSVTGGGAMHLNDAFGRLPELRKVYCHNEQACAIAADSYARIKNKPAAVVVTTGPGGINALNGVFGAYVDSLPMLIISGQIKNETLKTNYSIPFRQLGDQEVDILAMAADITKARIQASLEADPISLVRDAYEMSVMARPGPVWIDVPIDVQGGLLEEKTRKRIHQFKFSPNNLFVAGNESVISCPERSSNLVLDRLFSATKPAILVGTGLRISEQIKNFCSFIEQTNIPVLTGWNAHDTIPDIHKNYVGRPGSIGNRIGNECLQGCDFLLVLGCRLNVRQTSYNFADFARNADVAMVDIDAAELLKPTINIKHKLNVLLQDFVPQLLRQSYARAMNFSGLHREYIADLKALKAKLDEKRRYRNSPEEKVNPYILAIKLTEQLEENSIIVCGDGTACVATFQVAEIKSQTRLFTNSGCASMGYDLPAAIGAAVAAPNRRLVCIAGDGSIMMNLQELQTIKTLGVPLQIFILNNQGYHSIRQTQQNFFADNITGCGPDSGLEFPNFRLVAEAFGFQYSSINTNAQLQNGISDALKSQLHICEVFIDLDQQFEPKVMSQKLEDGTMKTGTLDNMWPYQ